MINLYMYYIQELGLFSFPDNIQSGYCPKPEWNYFLA